MNLIYKTFDFLFKKQEKFKAFLNKQSIITRYNVHKSVAIKATTRIYGIGKINIKEGTYFGVNSFIVAHPQSATITIGENCMISHDVHIRTSQYDVTTLHLNPKLRKTTSKDITIGNNVWIGKGVYIKGGVNIGDNVTIGANSVVVKDIEDNAIVGGIPARFIKSRWQK